MVVTAKPDMEGFLTQYFMQRVFNAMSDEQFAQYQDIIKNKDFIGHMKDWKEKWNLVKETAPDSGEWVQNDLPNPADFRLDIADTAAKEEWEKLYKELRDAFRALANNRKNLDPDGGDKKTLEFVDAFYGFGQLFSPVELKGDAKDQLNDELIPFLETNQTDLLIVFKDLGIYSGSDKDFGEFIKDLKKGKHNTDNNVRDILSYIVNALRGSYGPYVSEHIGGAPIPNLDILKKGLENDDVVEADLNTFKENYQLILNPIEKEKNIYQNFSPYLKTVKTAIETARKRVDYNNADSKDFLKEKRPDKKGPVDQLISNVKDSWEDHTAKYFSLHKSRLFYSDEAQAIAKAIDKAKFKPTEGLDKFVENLKKIGDNVKGNVAKQHFKWFSETLTKLHGDKQMSSIFADALKNPRNLKELAAEIAIQGIKDGKKDAEIHTAMEVLKTIQYGYATSNRLNAIMQQDLTWLSDKSLSWNKNEGMNVVMKGLDQTINFGLKGTALILTTGYNILNRNIGNKFNGKVPKRAAASFAAYQKNFETQRADKEAEKTLLDNLDTANRTNAESEITASGITADTLDAEKANLEGLKRTVATKQKTLSRRQDTFNVAEERFQGLNNIITAQDERNANLGEINTKLAELQTKIDEIDAKGDTARNSEIAALSNMLKQKEELEAQRASLQTEITNNLGEYLSARLSIGQATNDRNRAEHLLNNAQTAYNRASNKANDLDSKIEKFTAATQRVADANKRLDKREAEFNKWVESNQDRFAKLMLHWDFLNSGRKRTGENVIQQALEGILPLSQKARQKRYADRRNDQHDKFLTNYLNQYDMAA